MSMSEHDKQARREDLQSWPESHQEVTAERVAPILPHAGGDGASWCGDVTIHRSSHRAIVSRREGARFQRLEHGPGLNPLQVPVTPNEDCFALQLSFESRTRPRVEAKQSRNLGIVPNSGG
jgi:hypothetical protein